MVGKIDLSLYGKMKKLLILFVVLTSQIPLHAQENGQEERGTIRVQRTGVPIKVIFDDVNYRLVGIDKYGNVLDTAIVEFTMGVTIKGIYKSEHANGYKLSREMQDLLSKCDQTSRLMFDNIKAKDKGGNILEMRAFGYSIGSVNKDYDN